MYKTDGARFNLLILLNEFLHSSTVGNIIKVKNFVEAGECMKYITVSEAVEKWGVSRRAITYHLIAGRISGAVKKGSMWLIPEGAARPEDKRRKKSLIQKKDEPAICKKISDLYEQRRNGGTMLVANEEYLKFAKISTPERLYKKHNILLNEI